MSESITVNLSETVEAITVNIGEAALAEHAARTTGIHGISLYGASLVASGDSEAARNALDLTPAWVETAYSESVSLGTGDDIAENSSGTVYRWSSEAISDGIQTCITNRFQNSPEFPNGFNAGGDTLVVTSGSVTTNGNVQVGGTVTATAMTIGASSSVTWSTRALLTAIGNTTLRLSNSSNVRGVTLDADINGLLKLRNFANTADANFQAGAVSVGSITSTSNNLDLACLVGGRVFLSRGNTALLAFGLDDSIIANATTASTSSITGALRSNGGLGVAGNANIGGSVTGASFGTSGVTINGANITSGSFFAQTTGPSETRGFSVSSSGGYAFSATSTASNAADTRMQRGGPGVFLFGNGGAGDSSATIICGNIILSPSASVTPANNGNLVVEATSNTQLTFKLKGSDGVVRTATLALA